MTRVTLMVLVKWFCLSMMFEYDITYVCVMTLEYG